MAILGSMWKPASLHDIFSYQERAGFINTIHPDLHIQWIPDFPNDNPQRFYALDQIIKWRYRWDIKDVTFYWWCEEDLAYLLEDNRKCVIINRFDWISSPKISWSEIRDILLRHSSSGIIDESAKALEWILNPLIVKDVITIYNRKIAELKKR